METQVVKSSCFTRDQCTPGHYYFQYSGTLNLDDNYEFSEGVASNRRVYIPTLQEQILDDFDIDYGYEGKNLEIKEFIAKKVCVAIIRLFNLIQEFELKDIDEKVNKLVDQSYKISDSLQILHDEVIRLFSSVRDLKSIFSNLWNPPSKYSFFWEFRRKLYFETISKQEYKVLSRWYKMFINARRSVFSDRKVRIYVFLFRQKRLQSSKNVSSVFGIGENDDDDDDDEGAYKDSLIKILKILDPQHGKEVIKKKDSFDELALEHIINLVLLKQAIKNTEFDSSKKYKEYFYSSLYTKLQNTVN